MTNKELIQSIVKDFESILSKNSSNNVAKQIPPWRFNSPYFYRSLLFFSKPNGMPSYNQDLIIPGIFNQEKEIQHVEFKTETKVDKNQAKSKNKENLPINQLYQTSITSYFKNNLQNKNENENCLFQNPISVNDYIEQKISKNKKVKVSTPIRDKSLLNFSLLASPILKQNEISTRQRKSPRNLLSSNILKQCNTNLRKDVPLNLDKNTCKKNKHNNLSEKENTSKEKLVLKKEAVKAKIVEKVYCLFESEDEEAVENVSYENNSSNKNISETNKCCLKDQSKSNQADKINSEEMLRMKSVKVVLEKLPLEFETKIEYSKYLVAKNKLDKVLNNTKNVESPRILRSKKKSDKIFEDDSNNNQNMEKSLLNQNVNKNTAKSSNVVDKILTNNLIIDDKITQNNTNLQSRVLRSNKNKKTIDIKNDSNNNENMNTSLFSPILNKKQGKSNDFDQNLTKKDLSKVDEKSDDKTGKTLNNNSTNAQSIRVLRSGIKSDHNIKNDSYSNENVNTSLFNPVVNKKRAKSNVFDKILTKDMVLSNDTIWEQNYSSDDDKNDENNKTSSSDNEMDLFKGEICLKQKLCISYSKSHRKRRLSESPVKNIEHCEKKKKKPDEKKTVEKEEEYEKWVKNFNSMCAEVDKTTLIID